MKNSSPLTHPQAFQLRHIGPNAEQQQKMLAFLGVKSIGDLMSATVPGGIRVNMPLQLESPLGEHEMLREMKRLAGKNTLYRSYIGMGYVDTITPPVILRNVLENPGWYTQYTPYQAEISQGRLEALLNFQTMIMDLTALPMSNASLLDEGTAAAEAMAMAYAIQGKDASKSFFVADDCHPQSLAVIETRAKTMGIRLTRGDAKTFDWKTPVFGALLQYPGTHGHVVDYRSWIKTAHEKGALVVMAADLMALAVLQAPGELGADMAVGNTQCFGVPMGYGGPHAAYIATRDEYKRQMPGRIIGLSKDVHGKPAMRLALQTREQHIRRDKATSNICTAQVLLAIMASMYAVYHGPKGVRAIAERIHFMTALLARGLGELGFETQDSFFNALSVKLGAITSGEVQSEAEKRKLNFRWIDGKHVGITFDETVEIADVQDVLDVFAACKGAKVSAESLLGSVSTGIPADLRRSSDYLTHPVFNSHHSETEMLRYIAKLQGRDLSLAQSMIPLGSCTMKLNATTEMLGVTWPEFAKPHPFSPLAQNAGYQEMITGLEKQLAEITGFDGISLQPNAGSQGEYAGLVAIRLFHEARGEGHRNVCLIPQSAHGTNPASAAMAGMRVVVTACDSQGNVDLADLRAKAEEHAKDLSCFMITYPSTHGVFEEGIREICDIIHKNGGQVYMDGANMNAQVGLCRPGDFGADVCHLNLHKTFCIPHGGGGPGMGPIGVKSHLKPFLPNHPVIRMGGEKGAAISAAPWGSASILGISYAYIRMMGQSGLKAATEIAILNANYVGKKLAPHYPVLYKGKNGTVAHECILDTRSLKDSAGVEVEDMAKRLMDYGFHAPTISFPVPGTMMIEPTESESLAELDRFCEAMILIREEVREIENGKADRKNNLLKNAPHTAEMVTKTEWPYPYPRERAAYPAKWVRDAKFWPAVARIDNVYGERNLVCACPPIEAYQ